MVGVGDQARDQIDKEVEGTAVSHMLDLAEVFEWVIDRLDHRVFVQQDFVE